MIHETETLITLYSCMLSLVIPPPPSLSLARIWKVKLWVLWLWSLARTVCTKPSNTANRSLQGATIINRTHIYIHSHTLLSQEHCCHTRLYHINCCGGKKQQQIVRVIQFPSATFTSKWSPSVIQSAIDAVISPARPALRQRARESQALREGRTDRPTGSLLL